MLGVRHKVRSAGCECGWRRCECFKLTTLPVASVVAVAESIIHCSLSSLAWQVESSSWVVDVANDSVQNC